MAALTCDICGGKLVGRAGGVFECDSCGMEYDATWARQKIQEIKGTVQVENMASRDSLLKRGQLLLEDSEWAEADSYFVKVLDIDPECAEAYLGKLMAELRCSTKSSLLKLSIAFDSSKNYEKVIRFGDVALKAELEGHNARIHERNARQSKADAERLEPIRQRLRPATGHICAGDSHTVGLKANGTVVAVGGNMPNERKLTDECKVSGWRDIVTIAAGSHHTVGLRADGTVVAVGNNHYGECSVTGWRDIVDIAAGETFTVGLKADGTVISTVSSTEDSKCDLDEVSNWRDIVAIAASGLCTVGLKEDGTVVGTGWLSERVSSWCDIVAITVGSSQVVGLKADGTVVINGSYKKCAVSGWRDIVAIAAGGPTVGLRADGTVVAVGDGEDYECNVESWCDIVAVAAGLNHTVGLRSDGTLIACGRSYNGQCDVSRWKLFNSLDTLVRAREEARIAEVARREAQETRRINLVENLEKEKAALQAELPTLKGLFSGIRRKEIESRLAEIEKELKGLR